MDTLIATFLFLLKTVLDLYILVLLFRILLHLANIDIFNPLHQWVIRLTNIPLILFQKWIPHVKGMDGPAVFLALLLKIIKITLIVLFMGKVPNLLGLLLWALSDLLNQLFNLYFYLILFAALLSWLTRFHQTPLTYVLYKLTEPIFTWLRRFIPPIGGLDLTPLAALLILQVATMLIIAPLTHFCVRLTFG